MPSSPLPPGLPPHAVQQLETLRAKPEEFERVLYYWQRRLQIQAQKGGEGRGDLSPPPASRVSLDQLLEEAREKPQWQQDVERTEIQAYELLNLDRLGLPLKAWELLKAAQIQAGKHLGQLPSTEKFLEAVLEKNGWQVSGFTRELALCLLDVAFLVGHRRGYHHSTGEVSFHLPQLVLALYLWPEEPLETSRKRVQRGLQALAAQGAISYMARVGNARKRSVEEGEDPRLGWIDGTVFLVRIRPGRARPLHRDDLAHPWRDLQSDTQTGRTVQHLLRRSLSQSERTVDRLICRKDLKEWALPPVLKTSEQLNDWDIDPQAAHVVVTNAIQDVKFATPPTRMTFIGAAASSLAKTLKDGHSRWMYFALLGGARALYEQGVDRFRALQSQLNAVLYEYGAGHVKNPGAVLVAKLKESGLWQELLEAWERCTWKGKSPPDRGGEL